MNESILEVVHESVRGMHEAGVVGQKTMRKFDALCLPPVKQYTAAQIKRIRSRIEKNPSDPTMLVTVRGLGYRFES